MMVGAFDDGPAVCCKPVCTHRRLMFEVWTRKCLFHVFQNDFGTFGTETAVAARMSISVGPKAFWNP